MPGRLLEGLRVLDLRINPLGEAGRRALRERFAAPAGRPVRLLLDDFAPRGRRGR